MICIYNVFGWLGDVVLLLGARPGFSLLPMLLSVEYLNCCGFIPIAATTA